MGDGCSEAPATASSPSSRAPWKRSAARQRFSSRSTGENAGLPEPSRLRFRIGINLGDVVVEGDNLMGDGVNVAARLEALSDPGGICISEAVYAQARDRLAARVHRSWRAPTQEHRPTLCTPTECPSLRRNRSGRLFAVSRSSNLRMLTCSSAERGRSPLARRGWSNSCRRQSLLAYLWDERLWKVFASAGRAAAFNHPTRRGSRHQFVAPLLDPPVGGTRRRRLAGRGAVSRRAPCPSWLSN